MLITHEEIDEAISSMHNRKSPGSDGLVVELFKNSNKIIIPKLYILFNNIMNSGISPGEWGKALICTLHKDESLNNPKYYRGISILKITSKLFTKIIDERLITWAENQHVYKEEQAGFRKGYSTIDQIFNLIIMCRKYLSKNKGRFYAGFIDFSSAFDGICHNLLFHQLM